MFCPSCGTQLQETAAFCPLCGRDVRPLMDEARDTSTTNSDLVVSWRGGQVALGILIVGLAFLIISASLLLLERFEGGMAWGAWLGSHAIGLVILAAVWLLAQHDGRIHFPVLGLCRPRVSWAHSLLLVALVLGLSIGGTALYAWAVGPLGIDLLLPPDVPRDVVFGGFAAVLTFEALAGWTPFTEEIFFRGFVMSGLVSRWGIVGASVGSSLIFSLFHLYPGVLIPIFFTGLLLATLYRVTGSIWPPIIAHAGQNTIALVAIIYGG